MSLRRLGFAAVLLVGLGALTAGLLELGVRILAPQVLPQDVPELWVQDPALGWKHKTNARMLANTGERDVWICTDAAGDRIDCDAVPRSDCTKRILALGDSYVEALAIPFRESVWQRIDDDTGACTSVAGVSAWYLSQYLAALRARLVQPGARFDLVILSLYVDNDLTDRPEEIPPAQDVQRRPFRLLPEGLSQRAIFDWFYPLNAWLESRSQAYVAARFAIRRLGDPGDVGLFGVSRGLRRSQLTEPFLAGTARGVALAADEAHRHGARFLVVVIPHRSQVLDPDGTRLARGMPQLADDIDMDQTTRELVPRLEAIPEVDAVVDLLPILRANPDPSLWGERDAHFSPSGHAAWSDAIRARVRALLELSPEG